MPPLSSEFRHLPRLRMPSDARGCCPQVMSWSPWWRPDDVPAPGRYRCESGMGSTRQAPTARTMERSGAHLRPWADAYSAAVHNSSRPATPRNEEPTKTRGPLEHHRLMAQRVWDRKVFERRLDTLSAQASRPASASLASSRPSSPRTPFSRGSSPRSSYRSSPYPWSQLHHEQSCPAAAGRSPFGSDDGTARAFNFISDRRQGGRL